MLTRITHPQFIVFNIKYNNWKAWATPKVKWRYMKEYPDKRSENGRTLYTKFMKLDMTSDDNKIDDQREKVIGWDIKIRISKIISSQNSEPDWFLKVDLRLLSIWIVPSTSPYNSQQVLLPLSRNVFLSMFSGTLKAKNLPRLLVPCNTVALDKIIKLKINKLSSLHPLLSLYICPIPGWPAQKPTTTFTCQVSTVSPRNRWTAFWRIVVY